MKYVKIDIFLHDLHLTTKNYLIKMKLKKKIYCKLLRISVLVSDQGPVEIINLHRKWKNEKTKNIGHLENHLQRELCF